MATDGTITLPIHARHAFRLHEGVATADIDGEEFAYSQAVGGGPLMFRIGDRHYEIETQELCFAVVEYDRLRAQPDEKRGGHG